jgi:hypothetical protein
MKENINEHDMTKKMMNIIRNGHVRLIKEVEEPITGPDMTPIPDDQNDTISPKEGDPLFKEELTKLQNTIDPRVKITNFKIYIKDSDVLLEGSFLNKNYGESGIGFKMSLASGEIETTMNNLELTNEVNAILTKLKGYYDVWAKEWSLKLSNEYNVNR